MDNRGYASRIIKANLAASVESPGVALGRFCITKEIPVSDVAEYFGVSRMTIYKWFVGEWAPRKSNAEKIWDMLKRTKFPL
jgi:predicted DNA-binding transcriptional regulator AlpA